MPFTVGFLQANARALGARMGEHRAAAAIAELKRRGVLRQVSDYRARTHGYRVALYDVARHVKASVRRSASVKRWWEHPLFGMPDGEFPRDLPRRLRKWKEPPR